MPMTFVLGGAGHFFRILFISFYFLAMGLFSQKDYPLPSAYCVMRVLKRLSPFGEL